MLHPGLDAAVTDADVLAVVSHGDVIKAVLATHSVCTSMPSSGHADPCSVSIARYTKVRRSLCGSMTPIRCGVLASTSADVSTDAPVGGGAGRARRIWEFRLPERFVVGTVGMPGERTFYLQAKSGDEIVSVAFEKQQADAPSDRRINCWMRSGFTRARRRCSREGTGRAGRQRAVRSPARGVSCWCDGPGVGRGEQPRHHRSACRLRRRRLRATGVGR